MLEVWVLVVRCFVVSVDGEEFSLLLLLGNAFTSCIVACTPWYFKALHHRALSPISLPRR